MEVTMSNVDANVISFQCPKCGHDLQQTIGLLKSNQRLFCNGCGVGISFDTAKLAAATEILPATPEIVTEEITIKFFYLSVFGENWNAWGVPIQAFWGRKRGGCAAP